MVELLTGSLFGYQAMTAKELERLRSSAQQVSLMEMKAGRCGLLKDGIGVHSSRTRTTTEEQNVKSGLIPLFPRGPDGYLNRGRRVSIRLR